MTSIMPDKHKIRQAVKWIVEQLGEQKGSVKSLIPEAALKFNLSPKEEQDLEHFYKEKKGQSKEP
ncbi:MAG: hypothetical protein EHM45_03160 [Desulfobacteraceae bacterium]|nr:MAG: hypothetical protein EHM45_03160 [Desulfobacteraceae bacterium]